MKIMSLVPTLKAFTGVMIAIVGTGALLNVAGQGKLGKTAQDAAKFITQGYGV